MKEDIINFNLIPNLAFRTMGVFFIRSKPCLKSINPTIWWHFTLHVFKWFLVLYWLLSGHLLGNSCSLGWPYVLFVFWLFVVLVISRFGLRAEFWVLIASVPDLCILFTFTISPLPKSKISSLTILCGCTASFCQTWSKTLKPGFLATWLLILSLI